MLIEKISAREIADSRGNPTIETEVTLNGGFSGIASVPEGGSVGEYEAADLRDEDGKGVKKAIANISGEITEAIVNKELNQATLDETLIKLDGTPNKKRLGANAILSVSLAFARASSKSDNEPLYAYFGKLSKNKQFKIPAPMMNIINGGRHAPQSTDFQEFMIVPISVNSITEAVKWGNEIYAALKKILEDRGLSTSIGDEGGFAPELQSNEMAVQEIIEAIKKTKYESGKDVVLALDVAASELVSDGGYSFAHENRTLTKEELSALYEAWVSRYPIISIEDPFSDNDWDAWKEFTDKLGNKLQIVGDDFFVTNKARLEKGVREKAGNAIIIKPNQAGTISETIETAVLAKQAGFKLVVSHRSGETMDSSIADLAVGLGAEWVKFGIPIQKERVAKYDRLSEIERELKNA